MTLNLLVGITSLLTHKGRIVPSDICWVRRQFYLFYSFAALHEKAHCGLKPDYCRTDSELRHAINRTYQRGSISFPTRYLSVNPDLLPIRYLRKILSHNDDIVIMIWLRNESIGDRSFCILIVPRLGPVMNYRHQLTWLDRKFIDETPLLLDDSGIPIFYFL
jgi:hypothetical protein